MKAKNLQKVSELFILKHMHSMAWGWRKHSKFCVRVFLKGWIMEKLKCKKTWKELNWGGKLEVGVYSVGKILMLKEKVAVFRFYQCPV